MGPGGVVQFGVDYYQTKKDRKGNKIVYVVTTKEVCRDMSPSAWKTKWTFKFNKMSATNLIPIATPSVGGGGTGKTDVSWFLKIVSIIRRKGGDKLMDISKRSSSSSSAPSVTLRMMSWRKCHINGWLYIILRWPSRWPSQASTRSSWGGKEKGDHRQREIAVRNGFDSILPLLWYSSI